MKLYSLPHSPYAARVLMQIRLQGRDDIEVLPPPVPLRTEAFFERFPLGKVPLLELDDGTTIAESWSIMEYLEDSSADPVSGLRPSDPVALAQMRTLARYADLHLAVGALFPLFRAAMGGGDIDAESVVTALTTELEKGDRLLGQIGANSRPLSLGDLALAPTILYLHELGPVVGQADPLAPYAHLQSWWGWINGFEQVKESLAEVSAAYHAFAERMAQKA